MQKAFVEWAQGTWEGIARALDFDKKRLQKTALRQELARGSEGEGGAAWSSSCSRNARPRKDGKGSGQVPFLLAERAR